MSYTFRSIPDTQSPFYNRSPFTGTTLVYIVTFNKHLMQLKYFVIAIIFNDSLKIKKIKINITVSKRIDFHVKFNITRMIIILFAVIVFQDSFLNQNKRIIIVLIFKNSLCFFIVLIFKDRFKVSKIIY